MLKSPSENNDEEALFMDHNPKPPLKCHEPALPPLTATTVLTKSCLGEAAGSAELRGDSGVASVVP